MVRFSFCFFFPSEAVLRCSLFMAMSTVRGNGDSAASAAAAGQSTLSRDTHLRPTQGHVLEVCWPIRGVCASLIHCHWSSGVKMGGRLPKLKKRVLIHDSNCVEDVQHAKAVCVLFIASPVCRHVFASDSIDSDSCTWFTCLHVVAADAPCHNDHPREKDASLPPCDHVFLQHPEEMDRTSSVASRRYIANVLSGLRHCVPPQVGGRNGKGASPLAWEPDVDSFMSEEARTGSFMLCMIRTRWRAVNDSTEQYRIVTSPHRGYVSVHHFSRPTPA